MFNEKKAFIEGVEKGITKIDDLSIKSSYDYQLSVLYDILKYSIDKFGLKIIEYQDVKVDTSNMKSTGVTLLEKSNNYIGVKNDFLYKSKIYYKDDAFLFSKFTPYRFYNRLKTNINYYLLVNEDVGSLGICVFDRKKMSIISTFWNRGNAQSLINVYNDDTIKDAIKFGFIDSPELLLVKKFDEIEPDESIQVNTEDLNDHFQKVFNSQLVKYNDSNKLLIKKFSK